MTFYDKRLSAASRAERRRATLLDGARAITLWPTLKRRKVGSIADDWKAVGSDLRAAMETALADARDR